jgi:hypothetical protein
VPLRPSNASIALLLQLLMMLKMLSEVALIAASALRFSRSPVQGGAAAAAAADDDDAAAAFDVRSNSNMSLQGRRTFMERSDAG